MRQLLVYLSSLLLLATALHAAPPLPEPGTDGPSQRAFQVAVLVKISEPVLLSASEGRLKAELARQVDRSRADYAGLEALGRTLVGIAPWLELGPGKDPEGLERERLGGLAVRAIVRATDPKSEAYLNYNRGVQPLVDAAFLAQALLRAPKQLWGKLDGTTRVNVVEALKKTRVVKPYESNWLLFSAMIEATLLEYTGECDMAPIQRAVTKMMEWYVGDGMYSDGPEYHFDHYNSYVIQPMLLEVLEVCARHAAPVGSNLATIHKRAVRHAIILERLISPEGTFPIIGRSATYRFAALQTLSLMALRDKLPLDVNPGSYRAAMNAVIARMTLAPNTFTQDGWLTIGVVGRQPKQAEGYITPASCYICTTGLLQLGLPASHPFWTAPSSRWTQQRLWAGEDLPADTAISN